jgi:hypothetical protein
VSDRPNPSAVLAVDGTEGHCKRCQRRIVVAGTWWLDQDGRKECEAGHVHSVSGTSSMPHRLMVRQSDESAPVDS